MSPGKFSVNNKVFVNLLMGIILIFGLLVLLFELPVELMPKVGFNWVFVVCPYPGATPAEVEQLYVKPVEEALGGIEDVKYIASTSYEGGGFVWVVFEDLSEDKIQDRIREIDIAVNDVKLPEGAEDPSVDEFDTDDMIPIISVNIHGNLNNEQKNRIADDLKREFSSIKGISSVAVTGTRKREIWIQADPEKMEKTHLSIESIASVIAGADIDLSAGYVKNGREEIIVRTMGRIKNPDEYPKLVLRWINNIPLRVGDVSTLVDTFETPSTLTHIDTKPGISFSISKKQKGNSLEIIQLVKKTARDYGKRLPPGCEISFTGDTSISINKILGILKKNAYWGGLLVLFILFIALGLRNAFYVSLGIPISFMITFIFMNATGHSLNSNSLFALVLVLGIIVDDAIIVVENSFYHYQNGLSRNDAAILGTDEVLLPVLSATSTTIAAFLPLMFLSGIVGKFMRIVPIVVSMALIASILECFLILPSHFAHWGSSKLEPVRRMNWIDKLRKPYTRLLARIIRHRYSVLGTVLTIAVLSSGLIKLVGVEMFADEEVSQFFCRVTMPPGTRLEVTRGILREVENRAHRLPAGEVDHVISTAGMLQKEDEWLFNSDVGQVIVDLKERDERKHSLDELITIMETLCKDIPGPEGIVIAKTMTGPPTPPPVEIKVQGDEIDEILALAEDMKRYLEVMPGIFNIKTDFRHGKSEYRIIVDRDKAARYGLSTTLTAMAARDAIFGRTAGSFKSGDEDVDIIVKYPDGYFKYPDSILNLKLLSNTGVSIPLGAIAKVEKAVGDAEIKRFKGKKSITVSADITRGVTTVDKVSKAIKDRFEEMAGIHPGCSLEFKGEFEEFKEIWRGIGRLFAAGIFLIYLILGAQFKSFSQPFIILLTVPFAFLGAMLGLIVSGNPFSISTMYGIVALAGIAVNDSIVMLSFINNSRRKTNNDILSVMEAGRRRLRPIILTSITTILGLLPMIIGLGGKSPVWSPMANTIAWGLGAATFLTLLVIPAAYYIVVIDMPHFTSRFFHRKKSSNRIIR